MSGEESTALVPHSTHNSSCQNVTPRKDISNIPLYSARVPFNFNRTGTVRKANPDKTLSEKTQAVTEKSDYNQLAERNRESFDNSYKLNIDSISEHKAKRSSSSVPLYPCRDSTESSSSDYTDYTHRSSSTTDVNIGIERTIISDSSNYLDWIESVNDEYLGHTTTIKEMTEIDSKVGEWNNFWLNYNSKHNRHCSTSCPSISNDDKIYDEHSDCKSSGSTQKEFSDKLYSDQLFLSVNEASEAMRCLHQVTSILENALKRNEYECEMSCYKHDCFCKEKQQIKLQKTEMEERALYTTESQDLKKQPVQSNNSCVNVLLNTGVADILRKVIRRRDVTPSNLPSTSRIYCSERSNSK